MSNTNQKPSEPQRLLSIERSLFNRRQEIVAAKEREEQAAGALLAQAGEGAVADATDAFIRAEKELAALDRGINAVRTQRIAAITIEYAAQASACRREATEKRRQREKIIAKVEPLLDQLSKAEGVVFDRSILLHQRTGPWLKNLTCQLPASHEMEDRGIGEVYPDIAGCTYLVPASRRLLDESIVLELRAEEIERRTVIMNGTLYGTTVEALLEAAFADPLRIAPEPGAIVRWVEQQETAWREKQGIDPVSPVIGTRRLPIVFSDGRIDATRSDAAFTAMRTEAA